MLNFTPFLYFTGKVADQKSQYLEEGKDALLGVIGVITPVTSKYSIRAPKETDRSKSNLHPKSEFSRTV